MIRHVDNADVRHVGVNANVAAGMIEVRTRIDDAVCVVGVGLLDIATGERRSSGIGQVEEKRSAGAGVRAEHVREADVLVDLDVVSVSDGGVARGLAERDRRRGDVAQLGQVEHLDAGPASLADDVGVICVDLDVVVVRVGQVRRQVAETDRILRVGDVDERRAVVAPQDRVFSSGQRVGPTLEVTAVFAPADVRQR